MSNFIRKVECIIEVGMSGTEPSTLKRNYSEDR